MYSNDAMQCTAKGVGESWRRRNSSRLEDFTLF